MRVRFLKVYNRAEKKLVQETLGYTFEGNRVGIIAGSLDEIKIQRLINARSKDNKR
jgi:hypothetical protein